MRHYELSIFTYIVQFGLSNNDISAISDTIEYCGTTCITVLHIVPQYCFYVSLIHYSLFLRVKIGKEMTPVNVIYAETVTGQYRSQPLKSLTQRPSLYKGPVATIFQFYSRSLKHTPEFTEIY